MSIITEGRITRLTVTGALMLGLAGCAAVASPEGDFAHVADTVYHRTGQRIAWDSGTPDDLAVGAHIDDLLAQELTPATAIQVALINNKALQATYTELGIAQADLVQAGLLSNPVFDGAVTWPYKPEAAAANIVLGLAFNFIELFQRRLKEALAGSNLEAVKIRVASEVIAHAAKTHRAFTDYVAARQEVELFEQVVRSARASVAAATEIRKAGNMTALEFEQQQALLTSEKLRLADAQSRESIAREKLNVLMGLSGRQTAWHGPGRLPPVPAADLDMDVERHAVASSLELAAMAQDLVTLGYKYQLTRKQSLIPDLDLGVEWERDDGQEEVGPKFEATLPLFDRGEAKKARSIMEIRKAQDRYWAKAVEVRSAARLTYAALRTAREKAEYYERAMLPQRQRILEETQKQANAMTTNVFELIDAKRRQIEASQGYISALRTHWRAYVNFQQLMSGSLPAENDRMDVAATVSTEENGGE